MISGLMNTSGFRVSSFFDKSMMMTRLATPTWMRGKPDAGRGVQGFEHFFDQLAEAGVDALDRLGHEPQPLVRKLDDLAYRHGRRFKSCLKRGQCARLLRKLMCANVQGTKLPAAAAECGPRYPLQSCVTPLSRQDEDLGRWHASHVIKQSMERRTVASWAFLKRQPCEQEEGLVRKVTMTLTAAVLLLGTMALQAGAQTSNAALPASMRSGTQPRSSRQRRVTGEPAIAVAAPAGSARAPPLLPMRTLLVRGGSAIVPECIEAASARRPLALT